MKDALQHQVDLALDITVFEDGHLDLMDQHARVIATDLCKHDSGLEHGNIREVEKRVRDYVTWYVLCVRFGNDSGPRTRV